MAARFSVVLGLLTLVVLSFCGPSVDAENTDKLECNGFLLYCPCMGRFGNQAEHLLGTLALAKRIRRTLVIPPFIVYGPRAKTSFAPFESLFSIQALNEYTPVISMKDFMTNLADDIWPPSKRYMYCYSRDPNKVDCRTKQGNPFGPFWDNFQIDFLGDRQIPLYSASETVWNSALPPADHYVIATTGAPAAFPMLPAHRNLQKYIQWNAEFTAAHSVDLDNLERPLLSIHVRAGVDWERACPHGLGRSSYMASPQCSHLLGAEGITSRVCLPSQPDMAEQAAAAAKRIGAKTLYVGTDNTVVGDYIANRLQQDHVHVVIGEYESPAQDLYMFGQSDLFIGNCVSSFTSFAVRERSVKGAASEFWGIQPQPSHKNDNAPKEEL